MEAEDAMRGLSAKALKELKRDDLLESRAFVDGSWRDAAGHIAVSYTHLTLPTKRIV